MIDDLEAFWAALLSEDAALIRQAWADLSAEEAASVRDHLERMATEEGYSEPQQQAARTALGVIAQAR